MFLKEISLRAENLFTILSSVVNIIRGIYVLSFKKRIFTVIMNRIFMQVQKFMRELA